jgi:hypothetical protein
MSCNKRTDCGGMHRACQMSAMVFPSASAVAAPAKQVVAVLAVPFYLKLARPFQSLHSKHSASLCSAQCKCLRLTQYHMMISS